MAQDVAEGGVDQGSVETGAFVAIEDDPLIIDASAVMDGDGVGKIQVQWQISETGKEWYNLTGGHANRLHQRSPCRQELRVDSHMLMVKETLKQS